MDREKEIAFCGLACCVCGENTDCAGCRNEGCKDKEWCRNFNCCKEKRLSGCWECIDFPCAGGMLDKPRIRAFARFVKESGEDELLRCLERNEKAGIRYHYDKVLIGDYDAFENEDEIMSFIRDGKA